MSSRTHTLRYAPGKAICRPHEQGLYDMQKMGTQLRREGGCREQWLGHLDKLTAYNGLREKSHKPTSCTEYETHGLDFSGSVKDLWYGILPRRKTNCPTSMPWCGDSSSSSASAPPSPNAATSGRLGSVTWSTPAAFDVQLGLMRLHSLLCMF